MQKTKIEYGDYVWNAATGCYHGCPYCWARKLAEGRLKGTKNYPRGFTPTFKPHKLMEPLEVKKPGRILVSFMGDLFGSWVPRDWIQDIIDVCTQAHWHEFIFLTKNPVRYREFFFPVNCWIGETITSGGSSWPGWWDGRQNTFISFEPLLGSITEIPSVKWYIIGAQSKPDKQPETPWVYEILSRAEDKEVPIFFKENLTRFPWIHLMRPYRRQEYPKNLVLDKGFKGC